MSTPTIGATLAPYGELIKVSSGGREGIFSITAATSSALIYLDHTMKELQA